jgi:hypothetical protein
MPGDNFGRKGKGRWPKSEICSPIIFLSFYSQKKGPSPFLPYQRKRLNKFDPYNEYFF